MAAISARVDDDLKRDAESIADQLGLSISSVIAVFLKKFVSEGGFPFDLKLDSNDSKPKMISMSSADIENVLRSGIASIPDVPVLPPSTFFDPDTKQFTTTKG